MPCIRSGMASGACPISRRPAARSGWLWPAGTLHPAPAPQRGREVGQKDRTEEPHPADVQQQVEHHHVLPRPLQLGPGHCEGVPVAAQAGVLPAAVGLAARQRERVRRAGRGANVSGIARARPLGGQRADDGRAVCRACDIGVNRSGHRLQHPAQAAAGQPVEHRIRAHGLDPVGKALGVGVVVEGHVGRAHPGPQAGQRP